MQMPDVNILVGAHRREHPHHAALRDWLEKLLNSESAFGMSELALSAFLRIVTNPRGMKPPTAMNTALEFVTAITARPNCTLIRPGSAHFGIFARLCAGPGVHGNLVPDAYFAALAIEGGSRWITLDRDFARFRGLDWAEPFED